jgi:hypothetical protein
MYCLHLQRVKEKISVPEDGDSEFLRYVTELLGDYMASHLIR